MCKHHVGRGGLTSRQLAKKIVEVIDAAPSDKTLEDALTEFFEPEPDLSTFGGRVRHARTHRGIGVSALDRAASLSGGTITRIEHHERGSRLRFGTAERLAGALGVSIEWLAKGDGPNPFDASAPAQAGA